MVLDASALLAVLLNEAGGELVSPLVADAYISALNWAEVLQVLGRRGAATDGLREDLEQAGLRFASFTADDAEVVARLYGGTRAAQLSIADRACLALALRLGVRAVTGDRAWTQVDVGVDVRLFRNTDDA